MGRARPLPSTLAEYLKINLSEEQYFIKVFKKYWSGHFQDTLQLTIARKGIKEGKQEIIVDYSRIVDKR